jgi:preprotein translocase subunit SecD
MSAAMHRTLFALTLALLALLPATSFAGGKASKKVNVSFHMETEAADNPKMIFAQEVQGKQRVFRRVPELSNKDILSQVAFMADNGTHGVTLKLNERATQRWSMLSTANNGRWVVAQVNGRVCDVFLIDQQITDGIVVIWKNVTVEEVGELDKAYPRIGQENTKKKK